MNMDLMGNKEKDVFEQETIKGNISQNNQLAKRQGKETEKYIMKR